MKTSEIARAHDAIAAVQWRTVERVIGILERGALVDEGFWMEIKSGMTDAQEDKLMERFRALRDRLRETPLLVTEGSGTRTEDIPRDEP